MIGAHVNGPQISITGLGCHVPERVLTNDDLAELVDTNDEWIVERTGIRERRIAADDEALTDICLPAARRALEMARVDPASIDLLIVATVTPDMAFPSSSALLADMLGMPDAAAYDLSAGCTGFVYAIAQAHGMLAAGLAKRALVIGGDVLSKILDWTDRSTLVLFGDGAGAVVMERVEEGGFLGFELGADGGGGANLWLPGSGSRTFEDPDKFVKMNGREVFKFATRVMVTSADAILDGVREDGRRHRRVRPAPGERPNHRSRCEEIRDSRRRRRSSTFTSTATPRPARSRSRLPTRRTTDGSSRASWCC